MAAALRNIECSICQDRYTQPKILDCLHSFCEKCLETYYTSSYRGAPKIPCPVCRRENVLPETRIQGLKTNFHLMAIVEEISLQEKVASSGDTKVLCEICEEGNEAMHRCLDCAQNICLNCHKTHMRCTATSSHTVATFEDIRQGNVEVTKPPEADASKCRKHTGQEKQFYCETCEELICVSCTIVDHREPQHQHVNSGEASHIRKTSLKEMLPNLSRDITLEQSLAATSQAKQEFTKNISMTLKKVQDKATKIRAEVTAQEKKLIDEIKQLQQNRNGVFDEQEKTVSMMLQRQQHSLKTAKDVTDTASDSDFLSLYPIISKDLKSLSGQNPPRIDPKLSNLRFTPGQRNGDINLGKLEVEVVKWELCREFGKLGEFNGAGGIAATQPGEIAVADFFNERVTIWNTEGHYKRNIPLPECAVDIEAIHNHDNQFVVVDESKYVKVFNKDNKLAFQFPTVPQSEVDKTKVDLRGVAVKKDGTIIVGDVGRKVLTEHTPTDGSLISTIPVKTPPYYLAVDSCTDRVVISGKGRVDVADRKGVTVFTIKPTIDGQPVKYTRGVCCDKSGIYVAVDEDVDEDGDDDDTTGHIHHYDVDSGFLGCLAQGLYLPRGITLTADEQLAVADWRSVKMYHKV